MHERVNVTYTLRHSWKTGREGSRSSLSAVLVCGFGCNNDTRTDCWITGRVADARALRNMFVVKKRKSLTREETGICDHVLSFLSLLLLCRQRYPTSPLHERFHIISSFSLSSSHSRSLYPSPGPSLYIPYTIINYGITAGRLDSVLQSPCARCVTFHLSLTRFT